MKKIIALAVAAVVAAPAMADLTIGGGAEYKLSLADGDASNSLETNLDVAASTTSEGGLTVSAFTQFEATSNGDASTALDIDDIFLNIGNGMATVTVSSVGGFANKDAFSLGADTAAQISGYGASTQERNMDTAITVTPVEGLTVQLAGSLSDAQDGYSVYAGYSAGGVSVAASMEDGGTDATTGYGISASAALGEFTVGVDYAANDNSEDMTVLKGAMGAISLAYATDGTNDDIYGEYAAGEIAPGAALTLAAGSYESDSKVVAKLAYTF
jgi:hypothetical protein